MYSNQSDYDFEKRHCHSGQQSRSWDEEAKREEWPELPRKSVKESYGDYDDDKNYNQYNEDGNDRAESGSSRGHSKMYKRGNILFKDWRGKRTLSTERTFSEKKPRIFEDEDQRRYKPESEDLYRQSPEHYSLAQRNNNSKPAVSVDEGYSHKRTPKESGRYSQRQDNFHYSDFKEEPQYKQVETEYWDRRGPERNWSQNGMHSRDGFEKGYTSQRLTSGSFSRDHEDNNHNRTMFPLNGSNRQTEPSKQRLSPPPIPPPPPPPANREKRMSKGFQRFLNVLNMGVNVETLTKIVNQGSPDVNVRQPSPPPSYTDKPWTADPNQRPRFWPETERTPKSRFSPPSRTYRSNEKTVSEERFVESHQFERNHLENRAASPDKKMSNFEDDNKRRQMHDVLQAIGIDLEFEEVGQMSSRIQERLYGKKQSEDAPLRKEKDRRRGVYTTKRRSRSSSESSSGSFKDYRKSHSYSSQKEETDSSYYTDTNHPGQVVSPNTHARPNAELPQAPVMPPQAPVMPPQAPVIPPHGPFAGFTNFPPNFPPPFFPPVPQYHPTYPQPGASFPPMNMFPPVVPQNVPVQMPPLCLPHPFFPDLLIPSKHLYVETNAQSINAQSINAQTTTNNKNLKRPRCLQVISTEK